MALLTHSLAFILREQIMPKLKGITSKLTSKQTGVELNSKLGGNKFNKKFLHRTELRESARGPKPGRFRDTESLKGNAG